jgi:hypothetical protein
MYYHHTITEDHRFATRAEVESRTKEQLILLPHIPGDDLQVLCEEISLHAMSQHRDSLRFFLLTTSGTALFLVKYLESILDKPSISLYPGENKFDPVARAELERHTLLSVCQIQAAKAAVQAATCLVLAPERNVLGWVKVVMNEPLTRLGKILAYDPDRVLGKYDEAGSYAYDKSNIWRRTVGV